jgi:outer membrane protein
MMRMRGWIFGLIGCLLLGPTLAADLKIGYVNASALLQASPQAESVQKKLRDEFTPRRQQLEMRAKRLEQLEQDLSKNSLMLSEDQRKAKEKEIIDGRRELKHAQDEFQDDLRIRQSEEVGKLREQLLAAVEKFAKTNNYDLILYEGVIYASDALNVTDKVLALLKNPAAK